MERNWHFQSVWPVLDASFKVNCLSNVFSPLPVRLVQMRRDRLLNSWNPARCEGLGVMMLQLGLQLFFSILTQPQSFILRNSPGLLFGTALKYLGFCSISTKHMCHCLPTDLFWQYCAVTGLICEGLRWDIMRKQIIQVVRATLRNQADPSDNFIPK